MSTAVVLPHDLQGQDSWTRDQIGYAERLLEPGPWESLDLDDGGRSSSVRVLPAGANEDGVTRLASCLRYRIIIF